MRHFILSRPFIQRLIWRGAHKNLKLYGAYWRTHKEYIICLKKSSDLIRSELEQKAVCV